MQTSQEKHNSSTVHKNSSTEAKLLKITRDFDVPVSDLFATFTKADTLKVWWWPKGLYSTHIDLDFTEGGKYFINMKGYENAGGGGMTGHFEEIVDDKRIVMTDSFADEKGNAISSEQAKMPGTWPQMIYITFDFEEVDENKSRFTLSQEGIPNEVQKDCIQGWNESFDKLEKHLTPRKN